MENAENIDPRQIRPGPIRHSHLPPALEDLARHSYPVAGHYLCPTFEQWELGFLRDAKPKQEVVLWFVIAEVFQMATKERPDLDEKEILSDLVAISSGGEGKHGLDGVYRAAWERLTSDDD